jgi:FkbH-like protein
MNVLKCVVWDLDHTLWDGVVLESGDVELRSGVRDAVHALDRAGILQSVASRGDEATALARLDQLAVADYFLYPQITWADKSDGLRRIAEQLNLGLESFVLLDDDPYERAQVGAALPVVRCLPPGELATLMAEVDRLAATGEAARRREMYQAERRRAAAQASSDLSPAAFTRQLDMYFDVHRLRVEELDRAHELTMRTHQLNTTGIVYDRATRVRSGCSAPAGRLACPHGWAIPARRVA